MTELRRPVYFATNAQMIACIIRAQMGEIIIEDDLLDAIKVRYDIDFVSTDWIDSHFEFRATDIRAALHEIKLHEETLS